MRYARITSRTERTAGVTAERPPSREALAERARFSARLQRAVGNQATRRWLEGAGRTNAAAPDGHEREADRIAEHALRMPDGVDEVRPAPRAADLVSVGGLQLPHAIRAFFEPRFGCDFGHVRIHAGDAAAEAARAENAEAFTVGRNIVVADRHFDPDTISGRRLLAHELVHVVQQDSADTMAAGSNGLARSVTPSPPRIQRQQMTRPLWTEAQRYVTEREIDEVAETGRERGQIWKRVHYFQYNLADNESTRALRAAARDLAAKQTTLARLREEQQAFVSRLPWKGVIDQAAYDAKGAEILRAEEEYATVRSEKTRQHPILAACSDADIDRLGTAPPAEAAMIIGSELSAARRDAFERFVLQTARDRLAANQDNLAQWRTFVAVQLSAVEVQRQAFAQIPLDFFNIAVQHGTVRAFNEWAAERNPYMRRVREEQMAEHWQACTGCHEAVRAWNQGIKEMHSGAEWQSPAERLARIAAGPRPETSVPRAGPPPAGPLVPTAPVLAETFLTPGSAAVLEAAQRIGAILEPLGARGYKIIPEETMSLLGRVSPEELRLAILENIAHRHSEYETLKTRIANGDVSYLDLGPILSDLLPIADPDIRRAVTAEQTARRTGQIMADVGATLALLLAPLFPPLILVAAGVEIARGWQTAQTGYSYALGAGASNVFTPEQQAEAGELMASGGVRMAMGAMTLAMGVPAVADWGATHVAILSDVAVTRSLATRAAQGPIPAAELEALLRPGLAGRAAHGYLTWRGYQIIYRGQAAPAAAILSPLAREGGLPASYQMYQALRSQGLSDAEIAAYTARWSDRPVPAFAAPPGMADQPLGGVGIPTTRIPGIAAGFAQRTAGSGPIIYVFRVPRGMAINVGAGGWGAHGATQSLVEGEWVAFHQIGNQYIVRTIPAADVPGLMADYAPGQGWSLVLQTAP